jgi:hypothetical protein
MFRYALGHNEAYKMYKQGLVVLLYLLFCGKGTLPYCIDFYYLNFCSCVEMLLQF